MIRRLMLLTTLSVLIGVFVLSASVLAGNSAQPGKVTTPTTTGKPSVVQTSPSKVAVSIQSSSARSSFVGALRFSLRNWIGWPHIKIADPNPPAKSEPLKSGTDPNKGRGIWYEVERDNGGSSVDI